MLQLRRHFSVCHCQKKHTPQGYSFGQQKYSPFSTITQLYRRINHNLAYMELQSIVLSTAHWLWLQCVWEHQNGVNSPTRKFLNQLDSSDWARQRAVQSTGLCCRENHRGLFRVHQFRGTFGKSFYHRLSNDTSLFRGLTEYGECFTKVVL